MSVMVVPEASAFAMLASRPSRRSSASGGGAWVQVSCASAYVPNRHDAETPAPRAPAKVGKVFGTVRGAPRARRDAAGHAETKKKQNVALGFPLRDDC